jgi:hypothetical protein
MLPSPLLRLVFEYLLVPQGLLLKKREPTGPTFGAIIGAEFHKVTDRTCATRSCVLKYRLMLLPSQWEYVSEARLVLQVPVRDLYERWLSCHSNAERKSLRVKSLLVTPHEIRGKGKKPRMITCFRQNRSTSWYEEGRPRACL